MTTVVTPEPLDAAKHGALRVRESARVDFAARQHVMLVRAAEIGLAGACFPVFLNKHAESGTWLFSAMTSFVPGSNLFVNEGRWEATFAPSFMQTYPFFLVPESADSKELVTGIVPGSDAFSSTEGLPLYDEAGSLSLEVAQVETALRSDTEKDIQSRAFAELITSLSLHRPVDIVVSMESGQNNTIRGLHTVDEERLRALDDATVLDLTRNGSLMALHAMLFSMGQINALVQRHSRRFDDAVKQVRVETARDPGAGGTH
ncbi:MAG: SapC family protein [Pseudomonadota bacterium]